jgi:hypothetical protein
MMLEDLLEPAIAAAHLRLKTKYLLRQCRAGNGPPYLMPSPRKILFRKSDLDAWRSEWVERSPARPSGAGVAPLDSDARTAPPSVAQPQLDHLRNLGAGRNTSADTKNRLDCHLQPVKYKTIQRALAWDTRSNASYL